MNDVFSVTKRDLIANIGLIAENPLDDLNYSDLQNYKSVNNL